MSDNAKEIILYVLNVDKSKVSKEQFQKHLSKYTLDEILEAFSKLEDYDNV